MNDSDSNLEYLLDCSSKILSNKRIGHDNNFLSKDITQSSNRTSLTNNLFTEIICKKGKFILCLFDEELLNFISLLSKSPYQELNMYNFSTSSREDVLQIMEIDLIPQYSIFNRTNHDINYNICGKDILSSSNASSMLIYIYIYLYICFH